MESESYSMKTEVSWTPVSARFVHSINRFALGQGLTADDVTHVSAKVCAEIRRDVKDNAAKSAEVENAKGELKTKEVKEHKPTQRATGTKLLKLSVGFKEEWFLEGCAGVTQALVRIDQSMAGLEKVGAGIDWSPPVGSGLERYLVSVCGVVKSSLEATRKASPIPATNGTV